MQEQEKKLNIRLAGFSFDPLTETPDIPEELRVEKVPEGPAPTIVQFKKSLTREERVHIQTRYGLKLTDYIPEYAYLEAVTTATLRKLSTDPLLRGERTLPSRVQGSAKPREDRFPYRQAQANERSLAARGALQGG